jgi:hypothetical protein
MEAGAPHLSIEDNPVASSRLPTQLASLNERVVEAAALVTIAATAAFALVFAFRSGLEDSPRVVLSLLLNCLFPIWLTAFATCVVTASEIKRRTLASMAMAFSLLFPILGLALNAYVSVIAAICLLSIVVMLRTRLGSLIRRSFLRIPVESVPLALLLILSGDPARLLLPEAMTLGLAHTDSYFHAAIAQMIAHHHLPSTGADGLLLERYHFASHAVAAGLSKATGASVVLVYTYWGAISLKLQLLWAVFLSGLLLSAGSSSLSVQIFPRLVYAMLVLILSGSLESESLLFGLSLFLGLLPLLCSLTHEQTQSRSFHAQFAFAIAASFACAASKVSVGFYCAVALSWIAWWHRRSHATLGVALLGVSGLGVATVLFLSPTDIAVSTQALVHVIMSYAAYFIKWGTLLSYAVPILVILITITRPQFSRAWLNDRTSGRLTVAWEAVLPKVRSWRATWQLLLELDPPAQLLLVSLVACVLVLITIPIGSNMWYFSVVLLVVGSALLPSTLWRVSAVEVSIPPIRAWVLGAALVAGLGCSQDFATNSSFIIAGLFRNAWSTSNNAAAGADRANHQTIGIGRRQIAESIRSTRTAFGLLHREIATLPWTGLLRDLKERDSLAQGRLVVHVLPSADEFWRRLAGGAPGWWCMAAHLMIPAETGIVEIRSIEPRTIESECTSETEVWYGFGKNQDAHRTGDLSIAQLCEAADRLHSEQIYMLLSITQPNKNRIVNCRAP